MHKNSKIIFTILIVIFLPFYLFSDSTEQTSIDSIKMVNTTLSDKYQLVDNYIELSYLFGGINTDSSLLYSNRAITFSDEINYQEGLGKAHLYAARGYMQDGNIKSSIENFDKAIVIFKKRNDTLNMLDCYRGMSYVASYSANKLRSLEYNLKALSLAEALKDTVSLSIIYNNIGTIYLKLEDYESSLPYFEKTLEIEQQTNIPQSLATSYSNIGTLNLKMNNYANATDNYKKLLQILPKIEFDYIQAYMNLSISRYYNTMGKYDSSEYYLNMTKTICDTSNYNHIQTRLYKQFGDLRFNQKRYRESINYFNKSLELSNKLDISEEFPEIFKMEAIAYAKLGLYNDAYLYSQKAITAIDSLKINRLLDFIEEYEEQKFNNELNQKNLELALKNQQSINTELRMQLRYKLAVSVIALLIAIVLIIIFFLLKSKNKNNRLNSQHKIINSQNLQLESNFEKLKIHESSLLKLNASKDKFFSIIAHDLKSPFSAIIGFSDILSSEYNSLDDSKRLHMINSIRKSAKSTFVLLENLLTWARSQNDNIELFPESIKLKQLLTEGLEPNQSAAIVKGIIVNEDIDNDINVLVDIPTINIVISNLFNNAIKFCEKGNTINITGKIKNQVAEFCISDSGIGMNSEIREGLFSIEKDVQRTGTLNEKGTGLGLILCKEFVEKNNGTIRVESTEGEGSSFFVELPLAK